MQSNLRSTDYGNGFQVTVEYDTQKYHHSSQTDQPLGQRRKVITSHVCADGIWEVPLVKYQCECQTVGICCLLCLRSRIMCGTSVSYVPFIMIFVTYRTVCTEIVLERLWHTTARINCCLSSIDKETYQCHESDHMSKSMLKELM